ncbi:ketohydroxyglutarate aldolase [Acidilutibacter cellobiosedens]|jgi:2-dehydro-3-deoxyphosphogluconate aldolase/(4S)-4-hydroxy-2-oxoglutarate aldolase|uniref:Ketohydroxyglutarate aldolase n=2 Tax=Acidilutibacter cellobiosedens TaxID=2507161 RepID=A0A410QE32_9FIRM|nr:ketohydroxyglutarate aldolase [Acidilutibacter cellobiosedens]
MAIVRVDTIDRGLKIAEGCLNGGVDVLEISYTNNNAGEVIKALKKKFGSPLLIGAGTVLDSETARLAILNGAEFIIAPTFNKNIAELANIYQIPYEPGCSTYTEIVEALKYGAYFIKAFPISNFYGSKLVDIFTTPVPTLPILASGGITLDNLSEWIKAGVMTVGAGGLLTKGSKEEITANAKEMREIVVANR